MIRSHATTSLHRAIKPNICLSTTSTVFSRPRSINNNDNNNNNNNNPPLFLLVSSRTWAQHTTKCSTNKHASLFHYFDRFLDGARRRLPHVSQAPRSFRSERHTTRKEAEEERRRCSSTECRESFEGSSSQSTGTNRASEKQRGTARGKSNPLTCWVEMREGRESAERKRVNQRRERRKTNSFVIRPHSSRQER